MRCTRTHVTVVLGYPVERIDEYDENGLPLRARYEVLEPNTGVVLGRHASARAAKRFVIVHELRAIRIKRNEANTSSEAA